MYIYEKEALNRIAKRIHEKGVSNDFLVQLIILGSEYLNLMTVAQYAKKHDMTYKGVKENRPLITICEKQFVIDND